MGYLSVTLLGWPGVGKTTVGQRLERYGFFDSGSVRYVSGSDLLTRYIADKRPDWEAIRSAKDSGLTASPELTHTLLEERLATFDGVDLVLLDGFPKSLAEIGTTEAMLEGGAIDLALLLQAPADERTARIGGRLICGGCGLVTNASAGAEVSSACGGEECDGSLIQRRDDRLEVLKSREEGEPPSLLASHFGKSGRLVTIDSHRPDEAVVEEVVTVIERLTEGVSSQNPH